MRIYIGFDDTDVVDADRGTGKLARWFEDKLPEDCTLWGVVRQQFPQDERIPFTANNSSACVVVDTDKNVTVDEFIERATDHIREHFMEGSDPGLCVVPEGSPAIPALMEFGRVCSSRVVTQKEAMTAAKGAHLSGHGGTNDGIIGAAAGVGLTLSGCSGRFVEFGKLKAYPNIATVDALESNGIKVVALDRNAVVPWKEDLVETENWVRPRLWGHGPVLPVWYVSENRWRVAEAKNKKDRKARMN